MQRIYAGTAGGKRYFHGENGKLFDESGIEQTDAYAKVLKANFPPAPGTFNTQTPPPQASNQNQQNQPGQTPNPQNNDPTQSQFKNLSQQAAAGILRIAFPDLFRSATKYRRILNKKKKKTTKGQTNSSGNRKQWERELSLKIEVVGSNVRTNGELLRQQLTMQERSIELLEKISQGTIGRGKEDPGGIAGKLAGALGMMKKFILPALGVAGAAAIGGAALYMSNQNKQADNLSPNEDTDHKSTPKQVPSQPGDTQKDTRAVAEAKQQQHKPTGRTLDIKTDQLNFEAKTIRLEARTITINATSSSTGGMSGSGSGGAQPPTAQTPGGQQDSSAPQYDQMGNPTGQREESGQNTSTGNGTNAAPGKPTYGQGVPEPGQPAIPSDGRVPAGAVFKPDVVTPMSPGGTNPAAPGFGSVEGGQGAELLGKNNVYDPKNPQTPESIRQNDIIPTQSFKPDQSSEPVKEGGNSYLRDQRSKYADELKNPETRKLLGGILSAENPGAGPGVVESLMNRTSLVNEQRATQGKPPLTLKDMITGHPSIGGGKSFYGPMRTGAINEHLAKMNDPKYAGRMNHYINQALAGSNVVKGHTDQGSAGDPNYTKGGTGVNINGERFNDWGFKGAKEFRLNQQKQVELAAAKDKANPSKPNSITNANAQNTKKMIGGDVGVGDLGTMFGKTSMTDVKGMGGISGAAREMDDKSRTVEETARKDIAATSDKPDRDSLMAARIQGNSGYERPNDTMKAPPGKFTDELIENKLNEEAGFQRWLGWKQIGPGQQRRKELSKDPWNDEPGFDAPRPLDSINPAPGEIPEANAGRQDGGDSGGQSSSDGPAERTEGSQNRLSDPTNGSKKPKPIRQVDIPKYYPQYNDFGDSKTTGVGIGVA